jgi:transcription initiation factor IIE alpha subunit
MDNKGLKNDKEKEFLDSLNDKERMAYHIAKSHLGTMFSLDKCNAFLEWVNERQEKERQEKERQELMQSSTLTIAGS